MKKTLLVLIAVAVIVVFIGCGDTTETGLRSVSAQDVDPVSLASYVGDSFDENDDDVTVVLEAVGPLLIEAIGDAFESDARFDVLSSMAAATISAAGTSPGVGTAAVEFEFSDEGANPMTARIRISDEQWDLADFVDYQSGSIEVPSFRLDARVFFGDTSVEGSLDTRGSILFTDIVTDPPAAYSIVDGRINLDAVGEFSMRLASDDTLRIAYEYKLALKSGFSVSGPVGGKYIITFLSNGKGSFILDEEDDDLEGQLLANLAGLNLTINFEVYDNDNERVHQRTLDLEDILAMMETETI